MYKLIANPARGFPVAVLLVAGVLAGCERKETPPDVPQTDTSAESGSVVPESENRPPQQAMAATEGDPQGAGTRFGDGGTSDESGTTGSPAGPSGPVAMLSPRSGSTVTGKVTFVDDEGSDGVRVIVQLSGLTPGKHGLHIHETGDCSAPDASSAGGHFNPAGSDHGDPEKDERHMGDLGNLVADENGKVDTVMTFDHLELSGENAIVGRAVVVHKGEDDLATQPSGDAGARVSCGVIDPAGDTGGEDRRASKKMSHTRKVWLRDPVA